MRVGEQILDWSREAIIDVVEKAGAYVHDGRTNAVPPDEPATLCLSTKVVSSPRCRGFFRVQNP